MKAKKTKAIRRPIWIVTAGWYDKHGLFLEWHPTKRGAIKAACVAAMSTWPKLRREGFRAVRATVAWEPRKA